MSDLTAYPGDTIHVQDRIAIPPDPPPVEPPPNGIEVKPGELVSKLGQAKDGDVFLLRGGEHPAPFIIVRKKVTIQNWAGETPVLTFSGRPDFLYLEADALLRGLVFKSQSTGFDDSQGAALSEVRTNAVPIGLVWYDECTFIGTSKMTTREQIVYVKDGGRTIGEVRFTGCTFDGQGSQGFGIHPYSGPTPTLITVTDCSFANFPRNAAVLNAAGKCLVKVDRCAFSSTVTYARGMYGPVDVSNSKLSGTPQGTVNDRGGNTR